MKHWSVDTVALQKNPEAFAIWQLEQAVNAGLRDGKLDKASLEKYWGKLDLDPHKKKFLEFALGR
jgi:hypothetical protein